VYLAIKHGAPAPLELTIWTLAERFGWTLDYIESLPLARLHEFYQIEDGRAKARGGAKSAQK
jgi:hypothetical protein